MLWVVLMEVLWFQAQKYMIHVLTRG
uniref:Uncharacterized protein n=1 Tax=Rhizophora mucronata TaxID=61149 RepID=A0A2P2PBA9_RHIMU